MQIVQTIGEYASVVITILTALSLLFKPVRQLIKKVFRGRDKTHEDIKDIKDMLNTLVEHSNRTRATIDLHSEALMSTSRARILDNYYKLMDLGYIKPYQKEALIKEYEIYKKLGGNSFVTSCYEELMELPTKK